MSRPTLAFLAADPSRINELDRDALPELIGQVEAIKAALWARLQSPVPSAPPAAASNGAGGDDLLTAGEAAERLGVDRRWMYRHADTLPFTRKLAPGTLRFSSRGLERWKESRT